jgi:hypothetical protein
MKLWSALLVAASLGSFGTTVHAAPLGAGQSLRDPASARELIEKVHGCHRSAQDSLQGWHRHVGPYCRAVPASRTYRNPYARCRTKCQYVGPVKTCRRICR